MDLLRVLPISSMGGLKRALLAMFAVSLVFVGNTGRANPKFTTTDVPIRGHEPVGERPPGFQACPLETMSCYPGCAQVGDMYACGAQLIELTGGLAAAIIAVAESEDMSVEDFCKKYTVLCSKGGVQNKENEFVREARLRLDPCEWLQEQYDVATEGEREKIRIAQKYLGCRNKQKRKN